jgi:hypothetical protein
MLVLIIILKSGFRKQKPRHIKKALLGQGLVLVGLILSGYLLIFDRRKRNDIE